MCNTLPLFSAALLFKLDPITFGKPPVKRPPWKIMAAIFLILLAYQVRRDQPVAYDAGVLQTESLKAIESAAPAEAHKVVVADQNT